MREIARRLLSKLRCLVGWHYPAKVSDTLGITNEDLLNECGSSINRVYCTRCFKVIRG